MSRERPASAQRPYLLRAMHEWMTDNALTPHLVVDAACGNLGIPLEHIRENRIVLNVSYAATRGLVIGNDSVAFEARFNGIPKALNIPVDLVLGIYAKESGQGMVFPEETKPPPDDPGPADDPRPKLKVVK
ncbi:MAG TPA: ClpXP protease specificity-enhancing factor [Gammaproteobacteria bacterium]|nr:ClpXP protease specificity-enhancing factor [Gammaproteobacteria bacterium]